jgi:hypothetical protein
MTFPRVEPSMVQGEVFQSASEPYSENSGYRIVACRAERAIFILLDDARHH